MFKPTLKVSLADRISNILRQEILSNDISDGTLLNENELASRFGISRGPVREALRTLEIEGFVKSLPNGRTEASGFTAEDMQYYYNIRYFIESESIKIILSKPRDHDYDMWIEHLEGILNESKQYINYTNQDRFSELDCEFHMSFLLRADIKIYIMLWRILNNINKSIMEVNRNHILNQCIPDPNATFVFHDSILNGLKRHDLDYTLSNLQTHLKNGSIVYADIINTVTDLHSEVSSEN